MDEFLVVILLFLVLACAVYTTHYVGKSRQLEEVVQDCQTYGVYVDRNLLIQCAVTKPTKGN